MSAYEQGLRSIQTAPVRAVAPAAPTAPAANPLSGPLTWRDLVAVLIGGAAYQAWRTYRKGRR